MGKKTKTAILLLTLYLLVFWIGFKSGGSYIRMKRFDVEKIALPVLPTDLKAEIFYIVEKYDYGNYRSVVFRDVSGADTIIKMYMNEKLKPLLKLRDIEIYKETGERIY